MIENTNPIKATSSSGVLKFTDAISAANLALDFTNNIAGVSRFKIVTTTRDISVTGAQAITGAGFAPKGAVVMAGFSGGSPGASIGITDGAGGYSLINYYPYVVGQFVISTASLIDLIISNGNFANATITSLDADGMTITWAKTGSPTGTATLLIMFFR